MNTNTVIGIMPTIGFVPKFSWWDILGSSLFELLPKHGRLSYSLVEIVE
jgi:hypothetical protein